MGALAVAVVVLILSYLVLLAFGIPYAFGIALVLAIAAFFLNIPGRFGHRSQI